ncbi:MAG: SET domain-containing protein-lysine N-methyltransferase [Burkholderiaceae bacterium]
MPKTSPKAEKISHNNKTSKTLSKSDKDATEKALHKVLAKAQKLAKRKARLDALVPPGDFIKTRKSGVHGKGMFAIAPIAEGQHLIEYIGERIEWKEALRRHPHDPKQPNHTFYFSLEDGRCIDAKVGGNDSRWINHSCKPNCEADETHGRVFIKALRNIEKGEELFYSYGLVIDEKYTKKLKAEYACWCGAPKCRGTMLAPKKKD